MPETVSQIDLPVSDTDYPALFQAADMTSRRAQKRHLWFTGVILGALVACAALGALAEGLPGVGRALALAGTALAAVSFMVTSIRKALKPEKIWYGARAVAESAKTMAWRYMTGADPYPVLLSPAEADGKFVGDLKAMVKDHGEVAVAFGSEFTDRPQISPRMREVRSAPLAARRQAYVRARIENQRKWYGSKARKSQTVANRYFVVIQVSEALALAGSVLLLSPAGAKWNVAAVFSALAGALIAWLQVRQHEELAESYSVAALELGFVEEHASSVNDEKELSAFVADAENAISSEHSLWIIRHK